MALSQKKALDYIREKKIVLVYPIKDQEQELPSLWHCFHPRKKMVWDWSDSSGPKVAELWHFRQELASSKKAVYGKWYSGRAVFISKEFFPDFFYYLNAIRPQPISRTAKTLLEALQDHSPLSTKELKKATDLRGKFFEAEFHRATKELWLRMLICGIGEIDDGAFPSLAYAATELIFEDWLRKHPPNRDLNRLRESLADAFKEYPRFEKFFHKVTT